MEPKTKSSEKEDYGATGCTRRKPDAPPKEGPAPVHRGDDTETAPSRIDPDPRKAGRRK